MFWVGNKQNLAYRRTCTRAGIKVVTTLPIIDFTKLTPETVTDAIVRGRPTVGHVVFTPECSEAEPLAQLLYDTFNLGCRWYSDIDSSSKLFFSQAKEFKMKVGVANDDEETPSLDDLREVVADHEPSVFYTTRGPQFPDSVSRLEGVDANKRMIASEVMVKGPKTGGYTTNVIHLIANDEETMANLHGYMNLVAKYDSASDYYTIPSGQRFRVDYVYNNAYGNQISKPRSSPEYVVLYRFRNRRTNHLYDLEHVAKITCNILINELLCEVATNGKVAYVPAREAGEALDIANPAPVYSSPSTCSKHIGNVLKVNYSRGHRYQHSIPHVIVSKTSTEGNGLLSIYSPMSYIDTARVTTTRDYLLRTHGYCILVRIRNGVMATFLPIVNADYTNAWSNTLSLSRIPTSGRKQLHHSRWRADGPTLDTTSKCIRVAVKDSAYTYVEHYVEDEGLTTLMHMIRYSARHTKDVDYFITCAKYPKVPLSSEVPINPFIPTYNMTAEEENETYSPVLSYYSSAGYRDIMIPTPDEWIHTVDGHIPDSFMRRTIKRKLTPPVLDWESKRRVLFYRDEAYGVDDHRCTIVSKLVEHRRSCDTITRKRGLAISLYDLDVGITEIVRKITLRRGGSRRMSEILPAKLFPYPHLRSPIPLEERGTFTHNLYVNENRGSSRYLDLMSYGGIIVRVVSKGDTSIAAYEEILCGCLLQEATNLPFSDHIPCIECPTVAYIDSVINHPLKPDHIVVYEDEYVAAHIDRAVTWTLENPTLALALLENMRSKYIKITDPSYMSDLVAEAVNACV